MKKITIIGNSHVACLKKAWDQVASKPFSVDFFAHQGQGMKGLVVEGEQLVPSNNKLREALVRSSAGKSSITPNNYDVIVLVGLGLEVLHLKSLSRYSDAVTKAAYHDYVSQTTLYKLLLDLREISRKPIYLMHAPMKTKNSLPSGNEMYLKSIQMMESVFCTLPNVTMLPQPLETIVEDRFTAERFGKSALKLDVGNVASGYIEDGAHMNVDFGNLWLADLTASITNHI